MKHHLVNAIVAVIVTCPAAHHQARAADRLTTLPWRSNVCGMICYRYAFDGDRLMRLGGRRWMIMRTGGEWR